MRKRSVFQVLMALFMIATMLGANQSYAQDVDIPAATPAVEDDGEEDASIDPVGQNDAEVEDEPEISAQPAGISIMAIPEPMSATISGFIVDEDDNPVTNLAVCLSIADHYSITCVTTNGQGTYQLTDVFIPSPGSNGIIESGDPRWELNSTWFRVSDDMVMDLVAVSIEMPTGYNEFTFTGRVVDQNDNPISEFQVCFQIGRGRVCHASNGMNNEFSVSRFELAEMIYFTRSSNLFVQSQGCPELSLYEGEFAQGVHDLGIFALDCEAGEATIVPPDETPQVTPTETVPSTETPVVTPTETVPPTEVPTETPEAKNILIVTIALPDGTSIEGAPYNLYAAQASVVFQTEPWRAGVVGANNTIEISDLLPGTYKLVISPEGMTPIEAVIEIGDQPLTRVQITVHEDGSVTVEDVPQVAPTVPTEDTKDDAVTALPSTGTGTINGSMGITVLLAVAAAALMTAGGLAVRQKRG